MSLFSELKRRNVFKVATAYAVVGWLTIQVTESLAPRMALPEWVPSLIILLLLVGFPIALLLAWAYELTPDGIVKAAEVDLELSTAKDTSRKINYIIIGALMLIIGGMVFERLTLDTALVPDVATVPQTASIAVLPFVNMSSDPEQEYFSDGISEEILNVLSKIPNLHITSRSSSFSFKGTNTPTPIMAEQLGVNHVLEGSVRKSGTNVRITAQLIEAASDKHLWSETYDRDISDIFAVQDEISAAIVAALKEELGLQITAASTKSITINPEAFDLYLRGQESFKLGTFAKLEAAVASLKASLALEPDFQAARIALAGTITEQVRTGSRPDPELMSEAEALLNTVLAVEPDNGKAYNVFTQIAFARRDRASFIQYSKKAYSLNPNDAEIIATYISAAGPELDEVQSRALFERAERIDPLNDRIPYNKGHYLFGTLQAYGEAVENFKRALVLGPNKSVNLSSLAGLYGYRMGDIFSTIDYYEHQLRADPSDPDTSTFLSRAYQSMGDSECALKYANQALNITATSSEALEIKVSTLMALGRSDEALALIEDSFDNPDVFFRKLSKINLTKLSVKLLIDKRAYDQAEAFIFARYPELMELDYSAPPQASNENVRTLNDTVEASAVLAALYRASGKQADAKRITDLNKSISKEMLVSNKTRLEGVDYYGLAYAGMGRLSDGEVIDLLEASIDGGFLMRWRQYFEMDPVFMSLQTHPRYIALVERTEAEMSRQLALVNARDVNQ